VFGRGYLDKVPDEIDRLGATRVLVVAAPGRRKLVSELAAWLGPRLVGIFDRVVTHVPIETAEAARAEAARSVRNPPRRACTISRLRYALRYRSNRWG
jgi:maleylacetate reductase